MSTTIFDGTCKYSSLTAQSEAIKLQHHLSLLKEEYTKLQIRHKQLEAKYNALAANTNENIEETFASRLLKAIAGLYNSETYSDIIISLSDGKIHAHKLVLSARSDMWSESALNNKNELDWTDVESEVAKSIIYWLYTDKINLESDDLALKVMSKAYAFKLGSLMECCEQNLINSVSVRTCVKYYSVAEEIGANNLREYCSGLISAHWDDLDSSDFEHMSGPLLYKMLKSKTQLPLHAAVRLQREDVVFLCLVENASKVRRVIFGCLICKIVPNFYCILKFFFILNYM